MVVVGGDGDGIGGDGGGGTAMKINIVDGCFGGVGIWFVGCSEDV